MKPFLAALLLTAAASPALAYNLSDPETAATVLTLLTGAAWLALLVVPFGPGIIELLYPQDKLPLNINWNFVKDPFYFFKSFRALMLAKAYYFAKDSGTVQIQLSRPEDVDVFRRLQGADDSYYGNIVYAKEAIACGKNCVFCKEVYSLGDIDAGPSAVFRAVGAEGALRLGAGSEVTRWAAAEGPLLAEEGVSLGVSAASHKSLALAAGCLFHSLYAPEISTAPSNAAFPQAGELPRATELPACRTSGMLITRAPVRLRSGTELSGSVKSHSSVLLEAGAKVFGGIFAEGDIFIGRDCRVAGNVFAQGSVFIDHGVEIGAGGGIKSVIAKRRILLGGGVKVFGHISTQGRGEVLKA
ncbi:MAG: hypothetical protein NDI60_11530 [Elusimicrobiales bacterium]|nr:hypothetical protein [Elusimicrobiales bacterium]